MGYFIKLLISLLIVIFGENYFFKFMDFIGISFGKINNNIISLIIYLIISFCIYIIYKPEIKSGFRKIKNKFGSNIINILISFIVMFIIVMLTNYLCSAIAHSFNLKYNGLSFINIFNKTFNGSLIITIIRDIIMKPFIKVAVFVLGVNTLVKGKFGSILSGLLYASYQGYILGGSLSYILINVFTSFVLFAILAYLYKKNNNISFSIVTYVLYELLAAILIGKIV